MKRCKGVVGHRKMLHMIINAMTNSADATEFLVYPVSKCRKKAFIHEKQMHMKQHMYET